MTALAQSDATLTALPKMHAAFGRAQFRSPAHAVFAAMRQR